MFRRLVALSLLLAAVFSSSALAANVKVRVEGRTQTIYGAAQPSLQADNAFQALDVASVAGEFHYAVTTSSFGDYVSQVGKYAAAGSAGWVFKVNGALAAGRRRQGGAEGRRRRALVLGDVRLRPAGRRRSSSGGFPATATSSTPSPTPASARARRARRSSRTASASRRDGRACIGRHVGLVRATAPGAVRSNAVQVIGGASARCSSSSSSPAAVVQPGGGGDCAALGHARPRRRAAARGRGRRRPDADAGARVGGRRRDALRRPVHPVREGDRGQSRRAARTGSGSSTATRATAAPRRTGCATATSPGSTTAPGSERARHAWSSARFRSHSCTGTRGRRPAVVRYEGDQAGRAEELGQGGRRHLGRAARDAGARGEQRVRAATSARPRATAELLGETAGDPVSFVLSGELDRRGSTRCREPQPAPPPRCSPRSVPPRFSRTASGRSARSRSRCSSSACERRPTGAASISSVRSPRASACLVLSPLLWSSPDGTCSGRDRRSRCSGRSTSPRTSSSRRR